MKINVDQLQDDLFFCMNYRAIKDLKPEDRGKFFPDLKKMFQENCPKCPYHVTCTRLEKVP
jgi:hypothetical protein